ncbi:MAG TPA: AraC family transcriptional regulator [Verrucomicrobiae bacterium]|jgi:AraC-like DNA-binding protein|nr:AraC family transcriptional regulator [Verrucomicrobiae bacterium]
MNSTQSPAGFFSQLATPFTGEELFDCLGDLVFFIKNIRGEYVVVNQTLVERCGRRYKNELIGRRADEIFPPPLGQSYRAQDERVLKSSGAIRNQLELHFYPSGARGWCLTNKLPLCDRAGHVMGLVGISKDLQAANERSEDYSRVARVVHHIQTNFDEPLRVHELAARAGFSAYQFEQRVRKIFQLTAGQLIQKVRMENAVRHLRETDAAISAIALDCGYSDQSAFTRQFRQAIGMSPSECRRTFRQPAE